MLFLIFIFLITRVDREPALHAHEVLILLPGGLDLLQDLLLRLLFVDHLPHALIEVTHAADVPPPSRWQHPPPPHS